MKNLFKIRAIELLFCVFLLGCASTKTTAPATILEKSAWILDGKEIEQCHLSQTVQISGALKKGIASDGAPIFIRPYYLGENGAKIELAEISANIQKGQFAAEIALPALEAAEDSAAYFVPEFSFSVRLEDGTAENAPARLKAFAWIKTQFFDRTTKLPLANRDFVIHKLGTPTDEIHGKTDADGYLFLQWLPVGHYFITFD